MESSDSNKATSNNGEATPSGGPPQCAPPDAGRSAGAVSQAKGQNRGKSGNSFDFKDLAKELTNGNFPKTASPEKARNGDTANGKSNGTVTGKGTPKKRNEVPNKPLEKPPVSF